MAKYLLSGLFLFVFLWAAGQESEIQNEHFEQHHHLSTFAGFTTDYKGKNGYKVGFEYEYRLSRLIGVGGTFDFTGYDFQIFALSVGADFYPFKIPLVPGIMIGAKNYDSKWNPFVRGMLVYDFHSGNFSWGPMIMYDFFPNEKDIMSYGIFVGYSLH
jgi:hypothetical protein